MWAPFIFMRITMLELGKKQKLTVINSAKQGVYLAENKESKDKVLLPAKQCDDNLSVGDEIEVFLYLDSEDRIIATIREPMLTLGNIAILTVSNVTRIGAFLDWGLEKDLLLPDKEQTIYVYCRSGRRSKEASAKLAAMGYSHIIECGGILDWTGSVAE